MKKIAFYRNIDFVGHAVVALMRRTFCQIIVMHRTPSYACKTTELGDYSSVECQECLTVFRIESYRVVSLGLLYDIAVYLHKLHGLFYYCNVIILQITYTCLLLEFFSVLVMT